MKNQNETGKKNCVLKDLWMLCLCGDETIFIGDLLVMNSISLLNRTTEYLKIIEIHLF